MGTLYKSVSCGAFTRDKQRLWFYSDTVYQLYGASSTRLSDTWLCLFMVSGGCFSCANCIPAASPVVIATLWETATKRNGVTVYEVTHEQQRRRGSCFWSLAWDCVTARRQTGEEAEQTGEWGKLYCKANTYINVIIFNMYGLYLRFVRLYLLHLPDAANYCIWFLLFDDLCLVFQQMCVQK